MNSQKYKRLLKDEPFYEYVPASKLKVGDMVRVKTLSKCFFASDCHNIYIFFKIRYM